MIYCPDGKLGYLRARTRFVDGEGLTLDPTYRAAHLPLLAPAHLDVIEAWPERGYAMGRHRRIFSVVLPIPPDELEASEPYRELDAELRDASFARKVDWTLPARRRSRLHATLCGSLSVDDPPPLAEDRFAALAGMGPVGFQIRGLFSGNVNVGRLYLRLHPELREGRNMVRELQRCLGRPQTDLYLVGLHNFLDHLDAREAADLAGMIDRWWDRPLLAFEASHLWLLGARDDLVLDSEVERLLGLTLD